MLKQYLGSEPAHRSAGDVFTVWRTEHYGNTAFRQRCRVFAGGSAMAALMKRRVLRRWHALYGDCQNGQKLDETLRIWLEHKLCWQLVPSCAAHTVGWQSPRRNPILARN
jgi:hypothetical protein